MEGVGVDEIGGRSPAGLAALALPRSLPRLRMRPTRIDYTLPTCKLLLAMPCRTPHMTEVPQGTASAHSAGESAKNGAIQS